MLLKQALYFLAVVFILELPALAVSLSCDYGSGGGGASLRSSYSMDDSTSLYDQVSIEGETLRQRGFLAGDGSNSYQCTIWNGGQSISGGASSTEGISSSQSARSIEGSLAMSQDVFASGISEVSSEGISNERTVSQSAGALAGIVSSQQQVSVENGLTSAVMDCDLGGLQGYAKSNSGMESDAARITAGLNGNGTLRSHMLASAVDDASASGMVRAESLDSRAYAAGKAASGEDDVYSYLSSRELLQSRLSANAKDLATDQSLNARGDVNVYSSSASSDSYAAEADEASGRIGASESSTLSELEGDVRSTSSNLVPTPGSWVWEEKAGYLNSNPFMIEDKQGRNHVFVLGGDRGLYDNVDGNWISLGGYITSNPYAIKDLQGRLHILVRGSDYALYDGLFDTARWSTGWYYLGGYLTSDAQAAVNPGSSHIMIAVRGGDNALWLRDLNTTDLSSPEGWQGQGGIITSNPRPVFDYQGRLHTFARGADGSLFDNLATPTSSGYTTAWMPLGGYITSDPKPIQDPRYPSTIHVFARGGDGSLWDYRFNTYKWEANWTSLGGYIAPGGSRSSFYRANPEPVADAYRNIHALVVGGDGVMYDMVMDTKTLNHDWYNLRVKVTSDASAMLDSDNFAHLSARGADGGLLVAPYAR